jgi:hypothetical protein
MNSITRSLFLFSIGILIYISCLAFVRPYFPFPSDETFFYHSLWDENKDPMALNGRLPVLVIIYKYFYFVIFNLFQSYISSSYDILQITSHIFNYFSATIVFLIIRRFSGSLLLAILGHLTFAFSAWTFEYVYLLSQATFICFFFLLSVYASIIFLDLSLQPSNILKTKPKIALCLFVISSSLAAMIFSSSAGFLWSFIWFWLFVYLFLAKHRDLQK